MPEKLDDGRGRRSKTVVSGVPDEARGNAIPCT